MKSWLALALLAAVAASAPARAEQAPASETVASYSEEAIQTADLVMLPLPPNRPVFATAPAPAPRRVAVAQTPAAPAVRPASFERKPTQIWISMGYGF